MPECAITVDVDSLLSIFKGHDLQKSDDYNYLEYELGIENMIRIFDSFNIKATFFVVGQDLQNEKNQALIKRLYDHGHEIANHTMHHTQGFRLLSREEKNNQLSLCEKMIMETIGEKPVGFRSPGWNISDDALEILIERGYRYDSSVFPTSLMPLLKFMHFKTMSTRSKLDRTTMGQWDYMFASPKPYETNQRSFRKKGNSGFYEFPVTVTPFLRIPFFATFLLATGKPFFDISYQWIKKWNRPIVYLFHLFDFVDFSHPGFANLLPKSKGVYIPQSVHASYSHKLDIFRHALSTIASDYSFKTLKSISWRSPVKKTRDRSEPK